MPRLYNRELDTDIPPDAVYIGRPGPFGNPFVIGEHGTRQEVIKLHRDWLGQQPALVDRMKRELAGRDLVCWCAPQACHGDTILALVNS